MNRISMLVTVAVLAIPPMALVPSSAAARACDAPAKKKRGFGGLLSAVRRSGVEGAIAGALRGDGDLRSDLTGAARAAAERAAVRADCSSDEEAAAATEDDEPAPAEARKPASAALRYPSRMAVAPETKALIEAFHEFGKMPCDDCEGGYAYASWANQAFNGELAGEYNGWAKKLGNLAVGTTLPWKSGDASGIITVSAEESVEGFRCKRLNYRLTRGAASAERPGLVCWGKLNEYAGSDSWVEVF